MAKKTPEKSGPSEKAAQVDRRNLLKGAAGAGLGAMALGATTAASAQECPVTVQNLVVAMVEDPAFARQVIDAPELYKDDYNLSQRAVESLRGLKIEDFENVAVGDPKSFAEGAMTAAAMARHDFAAECGDTCYYFG